MLISGALRWLGPLRCSPVIALVGAALLVSGCGPSADFVTKKDSATQALQALRSSAPAGYRSGPIEGGTWPNEGRGPNVWMSMKRHGAVIDAAAECQRVRQWAMDSGATKFQDGNDGSNPVLPIAGNEELAQAICVKWWKPALTSQVEVGSPILIFYGTHAQDGRVLAPFTIQANAGVDAPATEGALTPWVNIFVVTEFQ